MSSPSIRVLTVNQPSAVMLQIQEKIRQSYFRRLSDEKSPNTEKLRLFDWQETSLRVP
jgi:hypothetical protein